MIYVCYYDCHFLIRFLFVSFFALSSLPPSQPSHHTTRPIDFKGCKIIHTVSSSPTPPTNIQPFLFPSTIGTMKFATSTVIAGAAASCLAATSTAFVPASLLPPLSAASTKAFGVVAPAAHRRKGLLKSTAVDTEAETYE